MEKPAKIAPAKGKLGVLLPGMGAVSTTFMAGVELVRKGKAQPTSTAHRYDNDNLPTTDKLSVVGPAPHE